MIIFISEVEAAALTFHMNIMRPSFRNIVKKKGYDRKVFMQSYDYLIAEATKALEGEYTAYALNMNIKDLEILHEFLRAYIAKAHQEADKAKSDELKGHLDVLSGVRVKANECLVS